jgi:DNA adenine methylase
MREDAVRVNTSSSRQTNPEVALDVLPLLRWAGSKKRQFKAYEAFFPSVFKAYVEPFAGSAAFFFRMKPKIARLNDINPNLADFYKYAKHHGAAFYQAFKRLPRTEKAYYRIRETYNGLHTSFEKSVLFYYLNRNCFNGIFRLNGSGEFNVPFSDNRVSPYLTEHQFSIGSTLLRRATINSFDFERFCKMFTEKDDFVFLDPPYYKHGQRIFNEYNICSFNSRDFGRLTSLLDWFDKRGVQFLLSFPRSTETMRLADKWVTKPLPVLRTVAGNPAKRKMQTEVLIRNYDH